MDSVHQDVGRTRKTSFGVPWKQLIRWLFQSLFKHHTQDGFPEQHSISTDKLDWGSNALYTDADGGCFQLKTGQTNWRRDDVTLSTFGRHKLMVCFPSEYTFCHTSFRLQSGGNTIGHSQPQIAQNQMFRFTDLEAPISIFLVALHSMPSGWENECETVFLSWSLPDLSGCLGFPSAWNQVCVRSISSELCIRKLQKGKHQG